MTENEKAFGFYAYTISLISTGLSSQKTTERAREVLVQTACQDVDVDLLDQFRKEMEG